MELLLPGFCAALILVGIHAYLGIHVIERGVIFVDLAMAQSAALGTMVGYLFFQQGPDHPITYLFSLGFTLVHAAMFAAGRSKSSRIPDEAVIGLTYAILSAITVLLIDRAPHGAERIRDMLTGHVLWVSWDTVLRTGLLYGSIGLIHFIWNKRFLMVSQDPEKAKEKGISVALWDFIFYATFGIIITSSVAIGGVLLVFSLLVAPAILGFMYARTFKGRLIVGYIFGFIVTLGGFVLSYYSDLPTGATVVACFGGLLFPLGIWRYIRRSQEGRGLRSLIAGTGVFGTIAVLVFSWNMKTHHTHGHDHAHGPHSVMVAKKTKTTKKTKAVSAHPHPHPHPHSRSAVAPKVRTSQRVQTMKSLAGAFAKLGSPAETYAKKTPKELLQIVEGKGDTALLDRQTAFKELCKKLPDSSPYCPFSGNLLTLDGWLKQRARWLKKAMRDTSSSTSQPSTKRRTAGGIP